MIKDPAAPVLGQSDWQMLISPVQDANITRCSSWLLCIRS